LPAVRGLKMIEVQGLTKKFKERMVLNDVNFQVKEGEIFGYLGPNGAGKTTTMRILLGLLKPTAGKALVWGKNLREQAFIPRTRRNVPKTARRAQIR
jgi:ABC-type multidrug transport system ATPase subunit